MQTTNFDGELRVLITHTTVSGYMHHWVRAKVNICAQQIYVDKMFVDYKIRQLLLPNKKDAGHHKAIIHTTCIVGQDGITMLPEGYYIMPSETRGFCIERIPYN